MGMKPFSTWGEPKKSEDSAELTDNDAVQDEGFLTEESLNSNVETTTVAEEVEDEIMQEIIPEDQIPPCPTDDTVFVPEETVGRSLINHPAHYTCDNPELEVIVIIEKYEMGFSTGNACKYILRAGHKDDIVQDLKKACWYFMRELQRAKSRVKELPVLNTEGLPTADEIADAYQLTYLRGKAVDFLLQYCIDGDVEKLMTAHCAICSEVDKLNRTLE